MSTTPDPNVLQEDLTLLSPPDQVAVPPPVHAAAVDKQTYYYVLGGILLVLLALIVWMRWHKRRARIKAAEAVDAAALRELAEWRGLDDPEQFRDAISAISGTLRRYVEGRFGLRAPTLTTEEFWDFQRAEGKVPQAHEPFWEMFFAATDGIKYAGLVPNTDEFSRLLAAGVDFVQSSRHGIRRKKAVRP
jgi:hypothetical protein